MNHPEIIRLAIAYTLVGCFIFTAVITCLSLVGVVRFAQKQQQAKLFYIFVVELLVGSLGMFFNLISLDPKAVANKIEVRGAAAASEAFASRPDPSSINSTAAAGDTVMLPMNTQTSQTEEVVIQTRGEGVNAMHIAVDGAQVAVATGESRTRVASGDHVLSWYIIGLPGSTYSIEIRAPASASFRHAGQFDASGRDAGLHSFRT